MDRIFGSYARHICLLVTFFAISINFITANSADRLSILDLNEPNDDSVKISDISSENYPPTSQHVRVRRRRCSPMGRDFMGDGRVQPMSLNTVDALDLHRSNGFRDNIRVHQNLGCRNKIRVHQNSLGFRHNIGVYQASSGKALNGLGDESDSSSSEE